MERQFDIKKRTTESPELTEVSSSSFQDKKQTSKNSPMYLVGSFVLCVLGIGISILTLIKNEESVAAPLVMVSDGISTSHTEFAYGPQPKLSQSNFFTETLRAFQEQKQSFIEADLSSMVIRYYKEGVVIFEAKILSKGKEGMWWETPAGLYKIELKKENHLSSFGGVYQPWSMVFQGNFFIHGWPYYPDGTPVSSQYSGGCIRLADQDAQQIYELANIGTPVLVYEDDYHFDNFSYDIEAPTLEARSFLVADIQSGTILVEHNASASLPIASITKLMTALVATEYINLDKEITVSEDMIASTSVQRLRQGQRVTVYSLLFPLLLESSNEAAVALASLLGKERFITLMNEKAQALGMNDTIFMDTSGAHSGNVSTSYDLLRLMTYINNNRSFLFKISSGSAVHSAYSTHSFGELSNFNETPGISGLIGGKVGKTTAALETSAVAYEMNIKSTLRPLAFIVLGTDDRFKAIALLHTYINNQYGALSAQQSE